MFLEGRKKVKFGPPPPKSVDRYHVLYVSDKNERATQDELRMNILISRERNLNNS